MPFVKGCTMHETKSVLEKKQSSEDGLTSVQPLTSTEQKTEEKKGRKGRQTVETDQCDFSKASADK